MIWSRLKQHAEDIALWFETLVKPRTFNNPKEAQSNRDLDESLGEFRSEVRKLRVASRAASSAGERLSLHLHAMDDAMRRGAK